MYVIREIDINYFLIMLISDFFFVSIINRKVQNKNERDRTKL